VAETYYRWQPGDILDLTADIQFMQDDYRTGPNPSGWIYSLRAAAKF